MERAAVLIGPQGYSAYEIAVANGFVGTQAQWLASLDGPQGETGPQGLPGTVPVTWAHYKDHWSAIPTPVGPTAGGSVLAYVLDVVTRYRFIPAPYDPARDAFYTTFTGGVLSGLIISRG